MKFKYFPGKSLQVLDKGWFVISIDEQYFVISSEKYERRYPTCSRKELTDLEGFHLFAWCFRGNGLILCFK